MVSAAQAQSRQALGCSLMCGRSQHWWPSHWPPGLEVPSRSQSLAHTCPTGCGRYSKRHQLWEPGEGSCKIWGSSCKVWGSGGFLVKTWAQLGQKAPVAETDRGKE